MDKRSRRRFTKEFKSETVGLIRHSGKSIAEVCRDMGLPESSVHRWLAQAIRPSRVRRLREAAALVSPMYPRVAAFRIG
jgi:transposase-like protein